MKNVRKNLGFISAHNIFDSVPSFWCIQISMFCWSSHIIFTFLLLWFFFWHIILQPSVACRLKTFQLINFAPPTYLLFVQHFLVYFFIFPQQLECWQFLRTAHKCGLTADWQPEFFMPTTHALQFRWYPSWPRKLHCHATLHATYNIYFRNFVFGCLCMKHRMVKSSCACCVVKIWYGDNLLTVSICHAYGGDPR